MIDVQVYTDDGETDYKAKLVNFVWDGSQIVGSAPLEGGDEG